MEHPILLLRITVCMVILSLVLTLETIQKVWFMTIQSTAITISSQLVLLSHQKIKSLLKTTKRKVKVSLVRIVFFFDILFKFKE